MHLIIDNTPTRASIAHHHAAMVAERRQIEQQIGVPISDSGRLSAPITVHCPSPGCAYAVTDHEGKALKTLAHHMIGAHWPQGTKALLSRAGEPAVTPPTGYRSDLGGAA